MGHGAGLDESPHCPGEPEPGVRLLTGWLQGGAGAVALLIGQEATGLCEVTGLPGRRAGLWWRCSQLPLCWSWQRPQPPEITARVSKCRDTSAGGCFLQSHSDRLCPGWREGHAGPSAAPGAHSSCGPGPDSDPGAPGGLAAVGSFLTHPVHPPHAVAPLPLKPQAPSLRVPARLQMARLTLGAQALPPAARGLRSACGSRTSTDLGPWHPPATVTAPGPVLQALGGGTLHPPSEHLHFQNPRDLSPFRTCDHTARPRSSPRPQPAPVPRAPPQPPPAPPCSAPPPLSAVPSAGGSSGRPQRAARASWAGRRPGTGPGPGSSASSTSPSTTTGGTTPAGAPC